MKMKMRGKLSENQLAREIDATSEIFHSFSQWLLGIVRVNGVSISSENTRILYVRRNTRTKTRIENLQSNNFQYSIRI